MTTTTPKSPKSLPTRSAARLVATGLTAVLALSACASDTSAGGSGDSGGSGGGDAANAKIAFLMPDIASTRYELFDAPLFTEKMKELCSGCEVLYQNAQGDASKQQQQATSVITQGASVMVIDPVDSAAAATIVNNAQSQNIAVISYDRPIPDAPPDYYISFDNEAIGAKIAQSLVDHLKETNAQGGLLEVNGSPTDAAAGLIKKGVHSVVDTSDYELLAEYDTPEWEPAKAQDWVSGQITQYRDQIAGVVAANDGTGGGTIAAFQSAGVNPVPPVTGNDAELAGIQRVIAGSQYNTISKPIKTVADAAAETAWEFAQGNTPEGKTTLFDAPSELFEPTVVTRDNVKDTVIAPNGPLKAAEVCTPEYAAACTELGIS